MLFGHILEEDLDGSDRILIPQQSLLPGNGKFFSRFIAQLTPSMLAEVVRVNHDTSDVVVAEIGDDPLFGFNGNTHPRMTGLHITYPSAMAGRGRRGCINVSDLDVRRDECDGVCLVSRTLKRKVLPLDLGFLAYKRRPPLFQILALFSSGFSSHLKLPWVASDVEGVWRRPRIAFESRLLLSRQAWKVDLGTLRKRVNAGSGWKRRVEWDDWRLSLGMPDEVYVSIAKPNVIAASVPSSARSTASQARKRPRRRLDYKPQYINFQSAAFTEILWDIVDRGGPESELEIEEMLPTRRQSLDVSGRRHMSEFIWQVDCGASRVDQCG